MAPSWATAMPPALPQRSAMIFQKGGCWRQVFVCPPVHLSRAGGGSSSSAFRPMLRQRSTQTRLRRPCRQAPAAKTSRGGTRPRLNGMVIWRARAFLHKEKLNSSYHQSRLSPTIFQHSDNNCEECRGQQPMQNARKCCRPPLSRPKNRLT